MVKVAASMGTLSMSLRGLAKPDTKGPAVASNGGATPTTASFLADAANTPANGSSTGSTTGSSASSSASSSNVAMNDDETPTRGQSSTFDLEVSRPLLK